MGSKTKIIFLGPLPPPVHGVSVVNDLILNSSRINEKYSFFSVRFLFSKTINEIGFFSFDKITAYFKVLGRIVLALIQERPSAAYFSISPFGFPFVRDSVIVLLLKLFNTRYIVHLHGLGVKYSFNQANFIIRYLYRFVFSSSHTIILSQKFESEVDFLKPKSISVVPNGIQAINYLNRSRTNKRFTILFLSNFVKSKGILLLIDGYEILLHKYNIDASLVLAGADGDISKSQLAEIVKHRQLPNVSLLGPVFGEDKRRLFEEADAFVYPTRLDYFPLVVIEAMQAGLPVISTDVGAVKEMIGGENPAGLILDEVSPENLAHNINQVALNLNLQRELSQAGKFRAGKLYSQEAFEENLLKVFNEIL